MFRRYWSLFILLIATYCSITFPLWINFKYHNDTVLVFIEIFISIIFIIDLILNYNYFALPEGSFLYEGDSVNMYKKKYLSTWFIFDLLSIPPYILFAEFHIIPLSFSFFSIFRFLKIIKITKGARFKSVWGIREFENTNFIGLFFLIFCLVNFAHWSACGWMKIGANDSHLDELTQYIRALYWSVTTLTTIGYGDITPVTNSQTIYAMFVMIVGAGAYGYLVAITASTLANADIIRKQFAAKLQKVTAFMKYKNIPQLMQVKVLDYYEYIWKNKKEFNESEVLEDLPLSLKMKIIIHLNKGLLRKVPIFKNVSDEVISEIISKLEPAVYLKGDMVIKKGEIGTKLFLISKGELEVLGEENSSITTLKEGSFFGEIALIKSIPRTASVRALEYCDLYYLEVNIFRSIIQKNPQLALYFEHLSEERDLHKKNNR